jgi:hypothetical protein
MAKKKRTKKKRQSTNQSSKSSNKESKKKEPPAELQPLGKVLTRMLVFMLVTMGIFYVTVHHIIGGVAIWKVSVLALLPLIQIATRRLSFGTPSIGSLLKPNGTKLAVGLGGFVVGNALSFAVFQSMVNGKPAEAAATKAGMAATFVLSPLFPFLVKAKAATWASFTALPTPTQAAIAFASFVFFYGFAILFHLEKDHLPVEREPLQMMAV